MLKRKLLAVFPSLISNHSFSGIIVKHLVLYTSRSSLTAFVYFQSKHLLTVLEEKFFGHWSTLYTFTTSLNSQCPGPFSPVGIYAGCGCCRLVKGWWQWKTLGLKTGGTPLVFSSADSFGISWSAPGCRACKGGMG